MKLRKKLNTVRVPPLKKAIRIKRTSSDVEEESTVSKAIQNVKKVFERKSVKPTETSITPKIVKSNKTFKNKVKRPNFHRTTSRGLVYLGHIPHGFYEEEMKDYFTQFGHVTRVRVVRSRNTGRSRGYGYIEFVEPSVAKVVAETMNNYLMCGRLLKATYISPERQHIGFFHGKTWTKDVYPKVINRNKINKSRNADASEEKHKRFVRSTRDKLIALEKKLKEAGFDLKFTPVVDSK
ncbi:MKI67 FHA domain-interacting nucleolar phosphoprotein-like [Habropoda laboriosa]|uniref:MKI67 FHA domain-interacting nucleolar phosphoprotein-like n=1 Tax=Habropoda laboriosa TaxID=597456 RepID=A0A0L7QWN0_9HYME|nr:PREDICTED: MKI67 FHA domain-interacting nucleolar phosphoprotein-like [Habropoda laboriosa]KOC62976.1 MKI67 FHA domain-interacting nucleolar phosphoprotein-like [Habropoda laboriosa]